MRKSNEKLPGNGWRIKGRGLYFTYATDRAKLTSGCRGEPRFLGQFTLR